VGIRLTRSDNEFLTSLERGRCIFYKDNHNSFTGEVRSVEHTSETGITVIVVENITEANGKFKDRDSATLNLSKWGRMSYSDSGATYHCHSTRSTVTFATEGC
jgi:hypothetical protein